MVYPNQINSKRQIDLSIVIVSFNTKAMTYDCLRRVEEHATGIKHEVIVVDNASTDGSAGMVEKEFPWVKLIRLPENRGFAGGNIPGMKTASGRYVLLMNSDLFLAKGVLENTISYMDQHPATGILGCKLTNPDGSLQPSARMLPSPLNKILLITGLSTRFPKSRFFGRVDFSWWDHSEPRRVGWVVGAYFLIRRETMDDIGYLDDRYFLYFEEVDYCRTASSAGWDVIFYPHAQVVHLGGRSVVNTNQNISSSGKQVKSIRIQSEFRYYRKFHGIFFTLVTAAIELIWCLTVFIRNLFRFSDKGRYRRRDTINTISLIFANLWKDRIGRKQ